MTNENARRLEASVIVLSDLKALELILSNSDFESRVDGFASFIRAQIEESGFNNWEDLVAQLVTFEDAILLLEGKTEKEFNKMILQI
jgi:hypothetical protein